MAMGNEPVDPGEQSNDKQNEDAAAALLALAGLAGLAGLAWLARKFGEGMEEPQKTQAMQVAESQKTDPFAQHAENMRMSAEIMRIHDINMETGRRSW